VNETNNPETQKADNRLDQLRTLDLPFIRSEVFSNDLTQFMLAYSMFVASRAKNMGTANLDLLHGALGAMTEAGELGDIAKKIWVYNQSIGTVNKHGITHRQHMIEELGDMFFYMFIVCMVLDVTPQQVIRENVDKLLKRYPVIYTDAAAAARADKTGKEE
jgi:NTP pyrophosphatase (non-canonical NTP hydrolase)